MTRLLWTDYLVPITKKTSSVKSNQNFQLFDGLRFVTFSALAHGASSVGLAVGVGSARVVMARVQGAARKNILELASLLRSDTS